MFLLFLFYHPPVPRDLSIGVVGDSTLRVRGCNAQYRDKNPKGTLFIGISLIQVPLFSIANCLPLPKKLKIYQISSGCKHLFYREISHGLLYVQADLGDELLLVCKMLLLPDFLVEDYLNRTSVYPFRESYYMRLDCRLKVISFL